MERENKDFTMIQRHHFDHCSEAYRLYRPEYPKELYDFILKHVVHRNVVWDCATGNGQAALPWVNFFKKVIATDFSQGQLYAAHRHPSIEYHCSPAEHTTIAPATVDLITIAQALHWFDTEAFYQEVRRVAAKNAVIAAWCYTLGHFHKPIDRIIKNLYDNVLGDRYWPMERKLIDEKYETITFPFKKIETPIFAMKREYNLREFKGYLSTWSAVKEYQLRNETNPIDLINDELTLVWGNPETVHTLHWQIHLLLGYVN